MNRTRTGLGCRAVLASGACALMLLIGSPVRATDDDATTKGTTSAAPAEQPNMAGCQDANGGCCGSCQEKAAEKKADEHAAGGCPCQRAKQAQKGS